MGCLPPTFYDTEYIWNKQKGNYVINNRSTSYEQQYKLAFEVIDASFGRSYLKCLHPKNFTHKFHSHQLQDGYLSTKKLTTTRIWKKYLPSS